MSVVQAALCSGVVGVLGISLFTGICLYSIESLFIFTLCSVFIKSRRREVLYERTLLCILLGYLSGILNANHNSSDMATMNLYSVHIR